MARCDTQLASDLNFKYEFIPFNQGQLLVFEGKVTHGSTKSAGLAGTSLESDLDLNEIEQILIDVLQPKNHKLNSGEMKQVIVQAMRDMLFSIASYDALSARQRELNQKVLIVSVVPNAQNLIPGAVEAIIRHYRKNMEVLPKDDFRHFYAFLDDFDLHCLMRYTFSFAKPVLAWELKSPFQDN